MPDQFCSVGDAQLRVVQVLRDQNPQWVDTAGECLPCVPHELELASDDASLVAGQKLVTDGGKSQL